MASPATDDRPKSARQRVSGWSAAFAHRGHGDLAVLDVHVETFDKSDERVVLCERQPNDLSDAQKQKPLDEAKERVTQ